MKIVEFEVIPQEITMMELPLGSRIIGMTVKLNQPYILALIDDDQTLVITRKVLVICSGKKFDRGAWEYHGTFLTNPRTAHPLPGAMPPVVAFHILTAPDDTPSVPKVIIP